jgi:hypothetical protein
MRNSLFLILCFLLLSLDLKSQRRNLDEFRFQTMIKRDTITLKHILHDSLLYIHSNGFSESKNGFIKSITSGKIVYQNFKIISRKKIHVGRSRLIYRGVVLVDGQYENQLFQVKLAFTSIYQRKFKSYQLVYWQSTKL